MVRSVADVVLVHGGFGVVPPMVAEGRRLLRNLQRVAKLFVTKSVFASVLIVSVGLTPTAFPLLPRHLTLAASVTIGIPAFFLALGPSTGPFRSTSFLRDVARFAIPAGTAAALGMLASYFYALNVLDVSLVEARTVATSTLVAIGLYLIVALEAGGRRRSTAVAGLVATMGAAYFGVLALEPLRELFALAVPTPGMLVVVALGAAFAVGGLVLTSDAFVPGRTAQ